MNKFTLLALTAASSAMFYTAPVWAEENMAAENQAATTYKTLVDKSAADYKDALEKCKADTGNAKKICVQEAKVARAKADADAVAQHKNTPRDLSRARTSVANAEYELAKLKCADHSGSDKSTCLREAKSTQTAAVSDARSGTQTAGASDSGRTGSGTGVVQQQQQRSAANTGNENCDQMAASDKAACLTRNSSSSAKNTIADTVITTKIKADLIKDPDLKAMDVHVETVNGVVMLSGFVPSQAEANKAVEMARGTEGVTDVKSALKVK